MHLLGKAKFSKDFSIVNEGEIVRNLLYFKHIFIAFVNNFWLLTHGFRKNVSQIIRVL